MEQRTITRIGGEETISELIRSARSERGMSQYALADVLARMSARHTINRDLVARWERGQIPRAESRRWLSLVLQVPEERFEAAATVTRRRTKLGTARVIQGGSSAATAARHPQGAPALLPVFRSRVQAGILAATLLSPHRWFSLTELGAHAGGSLASVDKEGRRLETAGILISRTDGTMRLFRAAEVAPSLTPLVDLIRMTYGVPQVIGEEFGRVPGLARIMLSGVWAQRFAGSPGPPPECIEIVVRSKSRQDLDVKALRAAAHRARERLRRPVRYIAQIQDEERAKRADLHVGDWPADQPIVEVRPVRIGSKSLHPADQASHGGVVVTGLVESGQLELVNGPAADSAPFLQLASDNLASAERLLGASADSAFLLLSHAAQLIASGLLAQQGLRPTADAGNQIAGQVVTDQFGYEFSHVERLRQRTAGLHHHGNRITMEEAREYIGTVHSLLSTARELTEKIALFVA